MIGVADTTAWKSPLPGDNNKALNLKLTKH